MMVHYSVHFSSQTHRQSQLPLLEKKAKKKYKEKLAKSQAVSTKVMWKHLE